MNIDRVRSNISKLKGKKVILKINIGRNRYESVIGIVQDIYPYLFTLKSGNDIKTFSYVDVLTKNVIIVNWLFVQQVSLDFAFIML